MEINGIECNIIISENATIYDEVSGDFVEMNKEQKEILKGATLAVMGEIVGKFSESFKGLKGIEKLIGKVEVIFTEVKDAKAEVSLADIRRGENRISVDPSRLAGMGLGKQHFVNTTLLLAPLQQTLVHEFQHLVDFRILLARSTSFKNFLYFERKVLEVMEKKALKQGLSMSPIQISFGRHVMNYFAFEYLLMTALIEGRGNFVEFFLAEKKGKMYGVGAKELMENIGDRLRHTICELNYIKEEIKEEEAGKSGIVIEKRDRSRPATEKAEIVRDYIIKTIKNDGDLFIKGKVEGKIRIGVNPVLKNLFYSMGIIMHQMIFIAALSDINLMKETIRYWNKPRLRRFLLLCEKSIGPFNKKREMLAKEFEKAGNIDAAKKLGAVKMDRALIGFDKGIIRAGRIREVLLVKAARAGQSEKLKKELEEFEKLKKKIEK